MNWASSDAGAKSNRSITVPDVIEEIIQDDGVLCVRQKCPLLSDGQTKVLLKLSNLKGYPLSKHIGDEYTIQFIANNSIALPQTVSFTSYCILNHEDHCISISEKDKYFHMFAGTIHDKNASITLKVSNAKHHYENQIINLGTGNITLSTFMAGGIKTV